MQGALSMDQAFVERLTDIILSNLGNEQFGVQQLSREMGMSHTTIHRRLRSCTNLSVSQFIREVRLQKAYEMLRQNLGSVSEISYSVGFGSPSYFNKCFHEYYGYPPGEARKPESHIHMQNAEKPDLLHPADLKTWQNKTGGKGKRYRKNKKYLIISVGILGGLLLAWVLYIVPAVKRNAAVAKESIPDEKSIVVLPFKNLSSDTDNEYFADGVTIDIRDRLSRIKGLKVISSITAEHFRGSKLTIPELADEIGVNYVLEGSARKERNMTRVSAKLIDVKRDRQLFSETFDRELSDIFSVQSEIAQVVAAKLEAVLSAEEIEQIEEVPTQNTEAHIYYLKGRYFFNIRTEESLKRSIGYYEKSIAADPGYAVAYAGLAETYYTLVHSDWMPVDKGFGKAKELAQKALELDPDLAGAHVILGGVYAWGEWQWEKAREEYKIAMEMNPNLSSAYLYYAELLDLLGENDEARLQLNIAKELDPFSRGINSNNMALYYNEGKFDDALNAWNEYNELNLAYFNPYAYYFYIYMYLGEDSLALNAIMNLIMTNLKGLEYNETLQRMYDKSGAMGILEWLNTEDSVLTDPRQFYYYGKRLAILGRNSEALDQLEKAFKARYIYMPTVYNTYDFRNLRNEPRFRAMLRQMNFPAYDSGNPRSD
jgi:TolB-like protein/AraC-like DNA-binding protein